MVTIVYIFITVVLVLFVLAGVKILVDRNVSLPPNLTDEVIANEAIAGRKSIAIKWYRHLHKTSLREAKQAVELMTTKS